MTFGENIRARRKELGISVDELAEKLGKNRATIYRYEMMKLKCPPICSNPWLTRLTLFQTF